MQKRVSRDLESRRLHLKVSTVDPTVMIHSDQSQHELLKPRVTSGAKFPYMFMGTDRDERISDFVLQNDGKRRDSVYRTTAGKPCIRYDNCDILVLENDNAEI